GDGPQDGAPGVRLGRPIRTPDGKRLAVAIWKGEETGVRLWDLVAGKQLGEWSVPTSNTSGLTFVPDGRLLAYVEQTEEATCLQLRQADTGKMCRTLTTTASLQGPMAFAPDNQTVAAAARDDRGGLVILWDLVTGRELVRCQQPATGSFSYAIGAVAF